MANDFGTLALQGVPASMGWRRRYVVPILGSDPDSVLAEVPQGRGFLGACVDVHGGPGYFFAVHVRRRSR